MYHSGIKKLAKAYEGELHRCGVDFYRIVAEYQSIRNVLLSLYSILVNEKTCVPIESMEPEEKEKLWQEAKRLTKNQREAIEICKALHAFGTFIQL